MNNYIAINPTKDFTGNPGVYFNLSIDELKNILKDINLNYSFNIPIDYLKKDSDGKKYGVIILNFFSNKPNLLKDILGSKDIELKIFFNEINFNYLDLTSEDYVKPLEILNTNEIKFNPYPDNLEVFRYNTELKDFLVEVKFFKNDIEVYSSNKFILLKNILFSNDIEGTVLEGLNTLSVPRDFNIQGNYYLDLIKGIEGLDSSFVYNNLSDKSFIHTSESLSNNLVIYHNITLNHSFMGFNFNDIDENSIEILDKTYNDFDEKYYLSDILTFWINSEEVDKENNIYKNKWYLIDDKSDDFETKLVLKIKDIISKYLDNSSEDINKIQYTDPDNNLKEAYLLKFLIKLSDKRTMILTYMKGD